MRDLSTVLKAPGFSLARGARREHVSNHGCVPQCCCRSSQSRAQPQTKSRVDMKKHEKTIRREVGAAVLLGPTRAHILAIALLGKLRSLGYSREAESQADLTGSDICAQAGYNPWGLVWLFQDFKHARKGEIPQLLSDHPNDQHRIDAMEKHLRDNPSTFASYSPDRKSATPFSVPDNAPVVFLR